MTKKCGSIYLIPNLLGGTDVSIISTQVQSVTHALKAFVVENQRNARRYLIKLGVPGPIDDWLFFVLDKHNRKAIPPGVFEHLQDGQNLGLLSDAGMPGVADPGNIIIAEAHRKNISVIALPGPSSIFMALAGSGLNGQQFCFHGYLPIEEYQLRKKLTILESQSAKSRSAQIFIETPYRNGRLFRLLTKILSTKTRLCVACNLSLPDQFIKTKSIGWWRKNPPSIHKKASVFILQG